MPWFVFEAEDIIYTYIVAWMRACMALWMAVYLYVYLYIRCVWVAFRVGDEFQPWSIEAVIALTRTLHPMKGMRLLSKLRVASPKTELALKLSTLTS